MIACLANTRLNDCALVAQPFLRAAERHGQLGHITAAQSAQLDALELVPDAFVGVELGSIPGQLLQVQALGTTLAQEGLDRLPAMDGRAIPDDQQLATDVARASGAGSARHLGSGRRDPGSAGTGAPRR
jgi:hypothetical protein